jgi:methyl-accepting chemotaxis protein
MKLSTKLTTVLISAAVVPMLAIGITTLLLTTDALHDSAFNHLVSIRDTKAEAIKRHFKISTSQVRTFSENEFVARALQQMQTSFYTIAEENQFSQKSMSGMESELARYYSQEFQKVYRENNNGSDAPLRLMLNTSRETKTAQALYIAQNSNPLGSKENLDAAPDKSRYSEHHGEIHPFVRSYLREFGYYDIFLVDLKGTIVYSVYKELDFGTSLLTGPYAKTNFGESFKEALKMGKRGEFSEVVHVDFAQYTPSYEAPASFAASPIQHNGECIGVAIMQLPIDPVNEIMFAREGMGETGETYLVGSDMLMRSDCYLDQVNRSVVASFKHPETGRVETQASHEAIRGISEAHIIVDYNGNKVLSAYAPIEVGGNNWAIISEMDEAEAFETLHHIQYASFGMIALVIVIAVVAAKFLSKSIMQPIGGEPALVKKYMETVASGNLATDIIVCDTDTISILYNLKLMVAQLRDGISGIAEGVHHMTSSTTELSAIATQLAQTSGKSKETSHTVATASEQTSQSMNSVTASVEEMSVALKTVAVAAEEMSSTIMEISSNASRGESVAADAHDRINETSRKMAELEKAAQMIGTVTETIQNISEQTNLLALNATIEAASAGEAGKGFAVVASEIKDLSRQTSEATGKIKASIEAIQRATMENAEDIRSVVTIIDEMATINTTIASAVEEQSATTNEISNNVTQTADGIGGIASNVDEVNTVTHGVTLEVGSLTGASQEIAASSSQVEASARELSNFAERLNVIASRYVV